LGFQLILNFQAFVIFNYLLVFKEFFFNGDLEQNIMNYLHIEPQKLEICSIPSSYSDCLGLLTDNINKDIWKNEFDHLMDYKGIIKYFCREIALKEIEADPTRKKEIVMECTNDIFKRINNFDFKRKCAPLNQLKCITLSLIV